MKKLLHSLLIATMATSAAQAADYKPLLEEGKLWIMARAKKGGHAPSGFPQMDEYVVQLECTVAEPLEIEGEQCRRVVVTELGSDVKASSPFACYEGDYVFLEKEGVISIYAPTDNPDYPTFLPVLNFNCQEGDSLLMNTEEYYKQLNYHIPSEFCYKFVTGVSTAIDAMGQERREIIFKHGGATCVEGIGASNCGAWLQTLGSGFKDNGGGIDYYLIECRKDGKTIFTNDDFRWPNRFGLQKVTTLAPGKSWTMARGSEKFTVSVDRDTLIRGISAVVLKSSEGNEYIAAEENGRIYIFPEHLGQANPTGGMEGNALLLSDVNHSFSCVIRRNWDNADISSENPKANAWHFGSTNQLSVGDREFDEYLFEDEAGEVVASWVDGVGAPDSRSWAVVMPEDFQTLRMIDCRQDGEVIFSAEDFTYQSGIREVNADASRAAAAYDLQGRRVANPTRGLYILNGKKHLLR